MPLFTATAELWTLHSGKAVDKSLDRFLLQEMRGALKAFLRACLPRIPMRTGFLRSAFKPLKRAYGRNNKNDLNPALSALLNSASLEGEEPGTAAKEVFEHLTRYRAKPKEEDPKKDPRNKRPPISPSGQEAQRRQYQREVRASLKKYRKNKTTEKRLKNLRFNEYYYYAKKQRVLKTTANALKFVNPKDIGDVFKISGTTCKINFDIGISYYRINDFYSRIIGAPWRSLDAGFQASLNYLEKAASRYPYITEILTSQFIYLKGSQVGKGGTNTAASYRRRFGTPLLPVGNIRGAKMTPYPGSGSKSNLTL